MMKKLLLIIMLFLSASLRADEVTVTMTTDEGFTNKSIIATMQTNLGRVLTEINNANVANRELNIVGLKLTEYAKKALTMLWANLHFYVDEEEVVDRCWVFNDGYMLRQIPLIINAGDTEFGSGNYQEAVVEFDLSGNIKDFRFALDAQLSESMERCGTVVEVERKMQILEYCERFRTAYCTKDMPFLQQVFSDDALIITGTVVQTKPNDMNMSSAKVIYKKQTKDQYLANLQRAFVRNKYIEVKFSQIGDNGESGGCPGITRSTNNKNMYGVRLRQEWKSTNYSDEGYVFLLWDFTDESHPVIHVRTWQPEYVGGKRLPQEEIFSLTDFDL